MVTGSCFIMREVMVALGMKGEKDCDPKGVDNKTND